MEVKILNFTLRFTIGITFTKLLNLFRGAYMRLNTLYIN